VYEWRLLIMMTPWNEGRLALWNQLLKKEVSKQDKEFRPKSEFKSEK
jgi:hypothetical protein